ncbi:hypothetical protein [uncultured Flavobacterium sp.]|uniref:hypothetical protein n=1 Tax=uncultured Flavobacterium sp. TaxID=165435 RepID=UPI0030EE1E44|tara:strand:+ start:23917 stop:24702 length:786 start_codon:yes stop_codon:yes gene_type:complete
MPFILHIKEHDHYKLFGSLPVLVEFSGIEMRKLQYCFSTKKEDTFENKQYKVIRTVLERGGEKKESETIICNKCEKEKSSNEFSINNANKNGYNYSCKECLKKSYDSNKHNNTTKKKTDNTYYQNNKKNVLEKVKSYQKTSRDKINTTRKTRRDNEPIYKLECSVRNLIYNALNNKGYTKKSKTFEILGCSSINFKKHIESLFKEGMNWQNRSEWHLDHIYPISLAKDEKHLIELNHYSNFQPLWAIDNIKKSNKIITYEN